MSDELRLTLALKLSSYNEPEKTFNYLFNKYKNLLIFIASSYLKDSDDVEDAVQETFVRFFNNADKQFTNIKSYLTTVVKNICIDMLKDKNKFVEYNDEKLSEFYNFNDSYNVELYDYLSKIKNIVGEQDCQIIIFHLVYEYTFKDISNKLNINEKTIKTRYYRALKKIKESEVFNDEKE